MGAPGIPSTDHNKCRLFLTALCFSAQTSLLIPNFVNIWGVRRSIILYLLSRSGCHHHLQFLGFLLGTPGTMTFFSLLPEFQEMSVPFVHRLTSARLLGYGIWPGCVVICNHWQWLETRYSFTCGRGTGCVEITCGSSIRCAKILYLQIKDGSSDNLTNQRINENNIRRTRSHFTNRNGRTCFENSISALGSSLLLLIGRESY